MLVALDGLHIDYMKYDMLVAVYSFLVRSRTFTQHLALIDASFWSSGYSQHGLGHRLLSWHHKTVSGNVAGPSLNLPL